MNAVYDPGVPSNLNSGIDPRRPVAPRFHPDLPDQGPFALWTFNGTLPPKLMIGRYGEPILFRHHNRLPADPNQNRGFGIHTITTHEHNGHHGAENDGFTGAYFFPGQFYDYHYPVCHGGYTTINPNATDPRCGAPTTPAASSRSRATGARPKRDLSLSEALSGASRDPCVGRFLEFRIVRDPARPDVSQVPDTLIPNPDLSAIPVAGERVFEFGRDATQTTGDPVSTFFGPWGIKVDGGEMLAADFGRISGAPKYGTREIWTLKNGGGGWDHLIHIHFEEGQILARDGSASKVPAWERGRKDVYRLRPGGSVTITLQFRDFCGMFMEHCHNTTHEDNAMLLRWEIDDGGGAFLHALPTPIPTPQGVRFVNPTDVLPSAVR